jgi:hypothetical protein
MDADGKHPAVYVRPIASAKARFATGAATRQSARLCDIKLILRTLLTWLSVATALVSAWMGTMFLILRHPHYQERAALSAVIFAGAVALAAGGIRGPIAVRAGVGLWSAALAALGLWALFGGGSDDGWVLIAGILFVAEGSTALLSLLRSPATA